MSTVKNRVLSLFMALALCLGILAPGGLTLKVAASNNIGLGQSDMKAMNDLLAAHGLTDRYGYSDPDRWRSEYIIDVENGRITSLNLSYEYLSGTLDVSDLPALQNLYCYNSNLTSLGFSGQSLQHLDCGSNNLEELDLSRLTAVTNVNFFHNPLTKLTLLNSQCVSVQSSAGGTTYIQSYSPHEPSITLSTSTEYGYTLTGYTGADVDEYGTFTLPARGNVTVKANFVQITYHPDDVAAIKGLFDSLGISYSDDPYSWNHVGWSLIGAYNRVTYLDLGYKGLVGTLTIPKLPELRTLYCNSNSLTGIKISGSPKLSSLSCNYNYIPSKDALVGVPADCYIAFDPQNAPLHEGDVAVIKNIIANNGLKWNADDPLSWPENCIEWEDVNGKQRIIGLDLSAMRLNGALDVSGLTELNYLDCQRNRLSGLDVNGNRKLRLLELNNNNIQSLDLSNNTLLTELACYANSLTTLDLGGNPLLMHLNCMSNSLTSLDVGRNPLLVHLDVSHNGLTALDVSRNSMLRVLYCQSNELTALDTSQNTELFGLSCEDNPIKLLDLRDNQNLEYLGATPDQLIAPSGATLNLRSNGNGRAGVYADLYRNWYWPEAIADDGYRLDRWELAGATMEDAEKDPWFQMSESGTVTLTAYFAWDQTSVRNLKATPGDSQVALTWERPNDERKIIHYEIDYRPLDKSEKNRYVEVSTDTLSHTITGLKNDVAYRFYVTAVFEDPEWGWEDYGNPVSVIVTPQKPSSGRDDSRRSSGGGGGGSTGTLTTRQTTAAKDPVTASQAARKAQDAVAKAKEEAKSTAIVRLVNETGISLEALQAMVKAADGMPIKVYADVVVDNKVVLRLSFDPALATKDLDFTTLLGSNLEKRLTIWFNGIPTVIRFTQPGGWGMPVEISYKLPVDAENDNLIFYSYDKASNTYKKLSPQPEYRIDANGYVVFATELSGDLIINNGPLDRK